MNEVVLQRVVFPWGIELPDLVDEVLPLYLSENGARPDPAGATPGALEAGQAVHPRWEVLGRQTLRIGRGQRASFDTYFNRVYAAYLKRWSDVRAVDLRVKGSGVGRIAVKRSTAEGKVVVELAQDVDLGSGTFRSPIALDPFTGGGTLWFEIEALSDEVILEEASWVVTPDVVADPVVDVAVCTFNRPRDVLTLLRALRSDPEFLSHVGMVWLVDNGTQSFEGLAGADELVSAWGEKLTIVRQPNLGGSGGFSRGMYESARRGEADYVFLMDDDVLAEPESLRRAVIFASLARDRIAVGGHMLVRQRPTVLQTSGERVSTRTMFPEDSPHGEMSVSVDREPLDRVVDVGYNAWWACLIPLSVVREIGLSLPFFIKFDDMEYGVRMARADVTTVTLPGVAVWHENWELKDQELDWTSYFITRNRLIAAAVLSGGLPESVQRARMAATIRHLVLREVLGNIGRRSFASALAANDAMSDFLRGPSIMEEPLDSLVGRVRQRRSAAPGGSAAAEVPAGVKAFSEPNPPRFRPTAAARAFSREFGLDVPVLPLPVPRRLLAPKVADEWSIWDLPQDRGPHLLGKSADSWWGLTDHPDAWVVTVDGSKVVRRTRNPRLARSVIGETVRLVRRVLASTSELSEQYSGAAARLSSPEAWEKQWNR